MDRLTDRKKTDRQLGIQSDEWMTDRLMHRQSNQLMDGKTYGLMDEQIDEWLNGWTDARIERQREKWMERWTDKYQDNWTDD